MYALSNDPCLFKGAFCILYNYVTWIWKSTKWSHLIFQGIATDFNGLKLNLRMYSTAQLKVDTHTCVFCWDLAYF